MGRPKEHGEDTRTALLRAGERLVAKGGPEAVSVRAVAEAVGTTTRAVYSLFGGKEGLLSALHLEAWRALIGSLDEVPQTDDPARDLIALAVVGFRRFSRQHPNYFRLLFESLVPDLQRAPADVAASIESFSRLVACVQRCIDAGIIRGRPALAIGIQWHALCQGIASAELHGWISPRVAEDLDDFWEDSFAALLAGLSHRPSAGGR